MPAAALKRELLANAAIVVEKKPLKMPLKKVKVLANMSCTPLKVKEIHVGGRCIQLFHIVGCCS